MTQTINEILAKATFYTDNEPYVLVKLPSAAITAAASIIAEISDPFCALIVDKDEVSVVLPHEAPEEFAQRLLNHEISPMRFRLITIDVPLALDLVGFMAKISAALADAGVVIMPYAAYTRDHLLVPEDQLETALATLERLKSQGT